ncbi:MAG: DUF896 domain-containing protein [Angelakisella sp.]
MEQEKINKINALARKSKTQELTAEEKAQQQALRKEYIAEIRADVVGTLGNTYLERPDGTREKIKPKK